MFALEVEYLMGRVLAAAHYDRRTVEWPPHPSRLFSALVAAYKECELGTDDRAALEWLEALPVPHIAAFPPLHNGHVRDIHEVFVPANDSNDQLKKGKGGKISLYPLVSDGIAIRRNRGERWFPAFTPQNPRVWFIWQGASGVKQHGPALQRIAESVTYLGHSMSPVRVRVRVDDSSPAPTLIPDPKGTVMLRTTSPGRLRHLEQVYELRKVNATIQPRLGRVTRYRVVREARASFPASVFRRAIAFRHVGGPCPPLESIAKLTTTVRKAVMALFPDPVPEVISGHMPDGARLQQPHLAIVPLADVGHRYADGHLMGFALWLPASAPQNVYEVLEDRLEEFQSVMLGRHGVWLVKLVNADIETRTPAGLRLVTYTKPADTWASVTPVVFGRFPKRYHVGPGKDGGKVFAELCEMIGLPRPAEVRLGPVSAFRGVPKASDFVPPSKLSDRFRAHVWVRFAQPVQGPVILGAGRYLGFGLCRPWFCGEHP
ncbi:MAG: type I-U CRISPR-associated protein Csb2 [Nitrospirota bacterium]